MAKYTLNRAAVEHAQQLIRSRQYVLDSDWGDAQHRADGDLRRLHRSGLIACVYRASEWRHKEIELAAHDLLQQLDAATGSG